MTILRRLTGIGVLGAGALAVRRLRERREAVARVAADLRTPLLYAIPSLSGDRSLRVARRLAALAPDAGRPPYVEERTIADGPRVLLYDAPGRERPSGALVWIHGGGLVLGRPEQAHEACARFAEEAGVLVVSVDYRLAPDDPFPAGLDDCTAAFRWVATEAARLGVDPSRIAVGGDSAGGGLAAAVSQRAQDEGGPDVAFQLLVYPMLDDRTALRTDHPADSVHVWSPASNRYGWTSYLGHEPSRSIEPPPHAVPARRDDLRGQPPAWIGVGDLDLFLDEDVEYARRLEAAGVPCELLVVPGMWHGADAALRKAATSQRFRDAMTAALTVAVGRVAAR